MKRSSVTLVDVARLSDVSKTTASNALNGRPGLKPETVERVLQAARELGFTPNTAARRLGASRQPGANTMMIGFLSDHPLEANDDPYGFRVLLGAQRAATAVSYHVVVGMSHETPSAQLDYVRNLNNGGVDGWILSYRVNKQVIEYLHDQGTPKVIAGDASIYPGITSIHSDNIGGAALATKHLIDLGHRKIGFAGLAQRKAWIGMRHTGYLAALRQAGLTHDDRHVQFVEESHQVKPWLAGLHSKKILPTAIFAATDLVAIQLMNAADELGIAVPGQLSISGYDEAQWLGPLTNPHLTSTRVPIDAIGETAFCCLYDEIRGLGQSGLRLALPVELIVRGSTAPPSH